MYKVVFYNINEVMTVKKIKFDLTSRALHILAMTFMLLDHMWATVCSDYSWMTQVGRIAFPIFAFMTVEGFVHTSSLKKYMGRMFLFAVITEIPFNLMLSGSIIYPYHQNVLWTFLIGLSVIYLNDRARKKGKWWLSLITAAGTALLGYVIGMITFVDYNGAGVLTVLVFYFLRERKWWCYILQLAALYYINVEMLQGLTFGVELFGHSFEIVQQGLALFALPFIWLYRGRRGKKTKAFQYFCYAFYPAHMIVLWLIMTYM